MSFFDKKPLKQIALLHNEVHLYSSVIMRATYNKLFGFAGPKLYTVQPLAPRYRVHITDRRLLMEIYPYSKTERSLTEWGLKGTSMLMRSFVDTPQASIQLTTQEMAYKKAMKVNIAATEDPELRYISIPYDILNVTAFGSAPSYLKLEISGIEEEIVFLTLLDITEGKLLPKGKIIENVKVGWGLSQEFAKLCQKAIANYHSRTKS